MCELISISSFTKTSHATHSFLRKPKMLSELPCIISNYKFYKLIGKGGFSSVYLVTSMKFDIPFVAKVTQLPTSDSSEEEKKTIENEVLALESLNHPNIIRLFDHFQDRTNYYMILEYCSGGSLQNEVSKMKGMSVRRFKTLAKQIVSALAQCHKKSIAHHDLKLGNILLDSFGRAKLADFGISVRIGAPDELSKSFAGSIQYESPEILKKLAHDPFKADIWALGVLFAHMINGQSPWRCDTIGKLKKCVMNGSYYISRNVPEEISDIIKKMIVVDPNERISIEELENLPFFAEHQESILYDKLLFSDGFSRRGRKLYIATRMLPKELLDVQKKKEDEFTEELRVEDNTKLTYQNSAMVALGLRNVPENMIKNNPIRARYFCPTFSE